MSPKPDSSSVSRNIDTDEIARSFSTGLSLPETTDPDESYAGSSQMMDLDDLAHKHMQQQRELEESAVALTGPNAEPTTEAEDTLAAASSGWNFEQIAEDYAHYKVDRSMIARSGPNAPNNEIDGSMVAVTGPNAPNLGGRRFPLRGSKKPKDQPK